MVNKKLLFITGTRADYGKMKSVISAAYKDKSFTPYLFVTGMHLMEEHGLTVNHIEFDNLYRFENHTSGSGMDKILATTVKGLSEYIEKIKPHMIIVHGDRVEALAGAIVGSLNNILVSHFEGGEVSGTVDDSLRHSITKLSHLHFVADVRARKRILQLGERAKSVLKIGAPEVDALNAASVENLHHLKKMYNVSFHRYSILLFHSVTTELEQLEFHCEALVDSVVKSRRKYLVISPNNDHGSQIIKEHYKVLQKNPNFRFLHSLPFEHYIGLLKGADMIVGNSSSGVKEAPYLGIASVNIGSRQNNRVEAPSIINCLPHRADIGNAIRFAGRHTFPTKGSANEVGAARRFISLLNTSELWRTNIQKSFYDAVPLVSGSTLDVVS